MPTTDRPTGALIATRNITGAAFGSAATWLRKPAAMLRVARRNSASAAHGQLLESFNEAYATSTRPMFVQFDVSTQGGQLVEVRPDELRRVGPASNQFVGVKEDEVRSIFREIDQRISGDPRFEKTLAKMCEGLSADGIWMHQQLQQIAESVGLSLDSTKLPPWGLKQIIEKKSKIKFYTAEKGTLRDRGILTWKRGKNGLSVKIKDAFEPDTHNGSLMCMGDGPYTVLEFVIELHQGIFRLNVIERDANGGSAHASGAIKSTLHGETDKTFYDIQTARRKPTMTNDRWAALMIADSWVARTAPQGPMRVAHTRGLPPEFQVLTMRKRVDPSRSGIRRRLKYVEWDALGKHGAIAELEMWPGFGDEPVLVKDLAFARTAAAGRIQGVKSMTWFDRDEGFNTG